MASDSRGRTGPPCRGALRLGDLGHAGRDHYDHNAVCDRKRDRGRVGQHSPGTGCSRCTPVRWSPREDRRRPTARRTGAVLAAAALSLTAACGGSSSTSSGDACSLSLQIIAPAAVGGGWDSTSRNAQGVLEREKLVKGAEVVNVEGAGGTIGLARLAGMQGKGGTLMTMGLVMVGAVETNKSAATLDDVTPIARLTSEQEAVVVPADSPFTTLADLAAAWKQDPGAVSIAGGSAGGTDQILAGLLAQAAGVDPKKVNYIAFSGGGEALAAILGGKVVGRHLRRQRVRRPGRDRQDARPRGLRLASGSRASTPRPPRRPGLDVELENWRGFVAPKGLSDADKKALTDAVQKMHDSQAWKDEMATQRLGRRVPAGRRVHRVPGRRRRPASRASWPTWGWSDVLAPAPAQPRAHPLAGKAELGLAGLLLALGVFLLVDAQRIAVPVNANSIGPRFFPTCVGVLLVGVAVARRRRPARRHRRDGGGGGRRRQPQLGLDAPWRCSAPSSSATRCCWSGSASPSPRRCCSSASPPSLGSRRWARDAADRRRARRRGLPRLRPRARRRPARRRAAGGALDGRARPAARRLLDGADAREPALGPARRRARHLRRRPARHRPGDDGGAAAADHLHPGAGQRVHHVRRHLLRRHVRRLDHRDPAQHARRERIDHDRARGQPDGPQGAGAAGPRHRGDRLVRRRHHRDRRPGAARPGGRRLRPVVRPGRLLRADLRGVHDRLGRARRAPSSAASRRSGSAWPSGSSASTARPARRASPSGVPQLLDGIDIVVIAVGLFAVGEALWVASRMRHGAADVIPVGRAWMGRSRLGPVLEAVAARLAARLPARGAAGRRRRDPDLPVVQPGEAALEAPGRVRARRHRGRRGAGGGQQRLRRRHARPVAGARAARRRRPPRSCSRPSSSTACSPGRCCSRTSPSSSGA